jgi:hypothetical protein
VHMVYPAELKAEFAVTVEGLEAVDEVVED